MSRLLGRGRDWRELADVLAEHKPTLRIPMLRLCAWFFEFALAQASGNHVEPLDEDLLVDSGVENGIAWSELARALRAHEAGDLHEAAARGRHAIDHAMNWSGVEDDFPYMWPWAVRMCLDAGDIEAADTLLDPVREAPAGLRTPAHVALLSELEGLVTVARGADLTRAEAFLRTAVDQLDAYGAVPETARTREVLGRLILSQGRVDEGTELLQTAARTFERLGATAWLRAVEQVEPAAR